MQCKLFPSLISANLLELKDDISRLDPYCDGYHLDVMDHHFVPNLTFGYDIIHAIARTTNRPLWLHLMVENPDVWLDRLDLPAGTILSFHPETSRDIKKTIKSIKKKMWRASIAISPKMTVDEISPYLHLTDQALIMSVNPGFSGQAFLESVTAKIEPLIQYRKTHSLSYTIGMDGGINARNVASLAQKGVSDFAIASGIFGQPNPVTALKELKRLIKI